MRTDNNQYPFRVRHMFEIHEETNMINGYFTRSAFFFRGSFEDFLIINIFSFRIFTNITEHPDFLIRVGNQNTIPVHQIGITCFIERQVIDKIREFF